MGSSQSFDSNLNKYIDEVIADNILFRARSTDFSIRLVDLAYAYPTVGTIRMSLTYEESVKYTAYIKDHVAEVIGKNWQFGNSGIRVNVSYFEKKMHGKFRGEFFVKVVKKEPPKRISRHKPLKVKIEYW